MALIKNNIVPIEEATQGRGRFMPKKNVIRVPCGKEKLSVTTETSYNFSKGLFVPDDCRDDNYTGSLIYRIGGIITDYNTADEAIPLTISSLTLYGTEIEGTTLTANSVTDCSYAIVNAPRVASAGTEPNKYGVFAQIYNIAGVIFGDGLAALTGVYFESNRVDNPDNFDITTVNPMAYMILELVFTVGTIDESHDLDICTFVDFQNLKD